MACMLVMFFMIAHFILLLGQNIHFSTLLNTDFDAIMSQEAHITEGLTCCFISLLKPESFHDLNFKIKSNKNLQTAPIKRTDCTPSAKVGAYRVLM